MSKSDKTPGSKRISSSLLSALPQPIRTRNRSASMPQKVSSKTADTSKTSLKVPTSQLPRPRTHSSASRIPSGLLPTKAPSPNLPWSRSTPAQLARPLSVPSQTPASRRISHAMSTYPVEPDAPRVVKPQPKLIINLLKKTMGEYPIEKAIVGDLMRLHDQELRLGEEREVSKRRGLDAGFGAFCSSSIQSNDLTHSNQLDIFTAKFRETNKYASASIVFDDKTHDLPILVIACIERLKHVGEYMCSFTFCLSRVPQGLDRISALLQSDESTESARFDELCEIFNSTVHFGNGFSLKHESDRNVHALLRSFMGNDNLSVVRPTELVGVIDDLCVPTYGGSVRRPDRNTLKTARYLLRLLPTANLSLFLYIFDFASRIWETMTDQLAHKTADIEKVRSTFGCWLFGKENIERSDNMMHWFLKNKDQIFPGLCSMTLDQAGGRNSMSRSTSMTIGDDDIWTPSLDRVGNFLDSSPPVVPRMLEFQEESTRKFDRKRLYDSDVPRYGAPAKSSSHHLSANLDILRVGTSAKSSPQRDVAFARSSLAQAPSEIPSPRVESHTTSQRKIEEDSDAECECS